MAYVANYLAEGASAISYGTDTYPQALIALSEVWGRTQDQCETLLNARYGASNFTTAAEALKDAGVVAARNQYGYNCWAFSTDTVYPVQTAASAVNSNASITTTVQAAPVIDTTIDQTSQKVTAVPATKTITSGGVTHNLKMFAGSAIQAISAAGLGISLGKTIDSTLYNLNPNFWDSVGMSTLNPETWATITNGDDSFAANLFNTVFGIDTDTGYGQMYLDENAAAYLAYWMSEQGLFAVSDMGAIYDGDLPADINQTYPSPLLFAYTDYVTVSQSVGGRQDWNWRTSIPVYVMQTNNNESVVPGLQTVKYWLSKEPFLWGRAGIGDATPTEAASELTTFNGTTFYAKVGQTGFGRFVTAGSLPFNQITPFARSPSTAQIRAVGTILFDGTLSGGIAGIGDQPTATLPNTSTWTTPQATLDSLKSQYPDLWSNAFTNNVVQPDGSVLTKTYIPVATPNTTGMQDTQPTSTTQTQQTPQVQPDPTPSVDNGNLLQTIVKYITQPKPEQQTKPETEPPAPEYPDTGTGSTDSPLVPTGSASALWSVYHPTQAQVDAFGAWLWTDSPIENIKKILNDPMSGIITLHKIFATPVDSGSGTIVIGKLDSGVSSATVNTQYVTVDCGSVELSEYFGNVFDYDPFTDVSLYLPFIGIVKLNTADVMRATLNVVYGVDVYTGACLAQVYVTRDGNTALLYQFAGVCSVEYPLTGGQHSGYINGLMALGASIVGVSTGNAPMALGGIATSLAQMAKISQARANSFSSNAGAMGIKTPYLIISRPQTKVAGTFPQLQGYPTNTSVKLGQCSGQVRVRAVHVENIGATEQELGEIENLLMSGVLV